MNRDSSRYRNRALVTVGLGVALITAGLLSPLASQNPDGLDRVSQDHQFNTKVAEDTPAHKLPFHLIFNEYAVRGVPREIATPLAGLAGTLITFGLAWGIGKLAVRNSRALPKDDVPEIPD